MEEDILAVGKAEAEAVLREAEKEKERLTSEAKEKAKAITEEIMRQVEKRVAQLRIQELASGELDSKRARLVMERELLEAATEQARVKLANIPKEQDEALLLAILKKHGAPGYRIYSAKKNEAFLRANSLLPYAGNIQCLGGILFESQDGHVREVFTYETILKDVVELSMREIARIMFSR